MIERPSAATALRAARLARGWSQSDAAREVAALGRGRGVPVASATSLKTLLSRWENGHVVPEPHYRSLLGELYDRTPTELGISAPPQGPPSTGPARLTEAIAAASAVDRAGIELWWEQLAAATRLDDELGAAAAGGIVRAQVERLDETLVHTLSPPARHAVAAVLAAAAALAGTQELDQGAHDRSWRHFQRSRTAAREAELPVATVVALAGQAEVLVDAGEPDAAVALLDGAEATTGPARVRLDAARGLARAAVGDHAASRAAFTTAERRFRSTTIDVIAPRDGPAVELADLHRWHGRALAALGDTEAVRPLELALEARPRAVRDRAEVHADLASALRAARPVDAAEHARTARQLATSIGAERIAARIGGTHPP